MKIAAITAVQSGLDILRMIGGRINIDLVIGLGDGQDLNRVSGYVDVSKYCSHHNLKYLAVQSYSLKDESDKEKIKSEEIDVLLVLGWQRLIPNWLIEHVKLAVLGGHGSAEGITAGRGRSPQNWALILGKKSFSISLFRIDAGIDSGPVLLEKKFNYSDLDDIETSYFKTSWLMSDMIVELLAKGKQGLFLETPQTEEARYLPKRTADDGAIDWSLSVKEIHNFIRGLAKPYPGAFSFIEDLKVTFWVAIPFDIPIDHSQYEEGEICQTFANQNFVVKCSDSLLLVRDWSSNKEGWSAIEGVVFKSSSFKQSMSCIIERHNLEMPNKPLNEDILKTLTDQKD